MTFTFRTPPLWASFWALIALLILISLGMWQLQRLEWKTELLQAYEEQAAKSHADARITAEKIKNFEKTQVPFYRGEITGRLDPENSVIIGPKMQPSGQPGYELAMPLTINRGTFIINLGWVSHKDQAKAIIESLPFTEQSFAGYLKNPQEPGLIGRIAGIENNPSENTWRYLNPAQIAKAKDLELFSTVIFYLEEPNRINHEGLHFWSLESTPRPNNNHLNYALFWFSMAGVMIAVFILRFCLKQA